MQQFSELTRSWSDTLTTLSVGSIALLLLLVGKINPDGSLSFALRKIDAFFAFTDSLSQVATLFMALILVSLIMALGYFIVQFGEFLAILADIKDKGLRSRERIDKCASNPAMMLLFSNAYTAYRLLCGLGAIAVVFGIWLIVRGAISFDIQPVLLGFFFLFWGALIIMRFARYSFASLDWILFGDLRE